MSDTSSSPAGNASRRILWWPLGIAVVMLSFALFGDRGLLHLVKQQQTKGELEQQLAQVEEVNAGLRQEIASLTADRRHLERMARTQLGMVRQDEVVYQFSRKARPAAPVPAASQ